MQRASATAQIAHAFTETRIGERKPFHETSAEGEHDESSVSACRL
jgi:hypothetical protein